LLFPHFSHFRMVYFGFPQVGKETENDGFSDLVEKLRKSVGKCGKTLGSVVFSSRLCYNFSTMLSEV